MTNNNGGVREVHVGDVIMSDAFVNAMEEHYDLMRKKPPLAIIESEKCDARDLSRAQAKFMVEQAEYESGGCFGVPSYNVVARRLNNDNTYNPRGELISFKLGGIHSVVQSVNKVGHMEFVFRPER